MQYFSTSHADTADHCAAVSLVLLTHFLISPSRAGFFFSFPLFGVLMNRAVDAKMSTEQLHLVTILDSKVDLYCIKSVS